MQAEEFFGVYLQASWIGEGTEGLEGEEVDVICAVDGLGGTVDGMGDGDATAEEGRIFDVVNTEYGLVSRNRVWKENTLDDIAFDSYYSLCSRRCRPKYTSSSKGLQ